MGMLAAGAYLRTLREGRGLSAEEVAAKMTEMLRPVSTDPEPVSPSTVWRIEEGKGKQGPSGYRLTAYLVIVGGLMEHLSRLMFDPAATVEDGEDLARVFVLNELTPTPDDPPIVAANLNRLIDLLAQGVPPQEAAEIVRREQ